MSTKAKSPAKKPVTQAQYEAALKRYATNSKASDKIVRDSEEKISKEMAARHKALGNMPAELKEDVALIQKYCEDNRTTLFGDAASIENQHCKLTFRKGNYAVILPDDVEEKQLIQDFKKKGLKLYIISKESIDKNKLRADRDNAALVKKLDKLHVEIKQGETFSIEAL